MNKHTTLHKGIRLPFQEVFHPKPPEILLAHTVSTKSNFIIDKKWQWMKTYRSLATNYIFSV